MRARLLLVTAAHFDHYLRLETLTRADLSICGRLHVEGFCRCFFQSTGAPADASDAGAWQSVPHCSEGFGLRCPPDKICFQT
jgi:hypothetical protein